MLRHASRGDCTLLHPLSAAVFKISAPVFKISAPTFVGAFDIAAAAAFVAAAVAFDAGGGEPPLKSAATLLRHGYIGYCGQSNYSHYYERL
jgi:hypothetical protein